MSAVAASATAMSACLKASTAVNALKNQSTALTAISTSPTAVKTISNNYANANIFIPLMQAINTSTTYVTNMFNILNNSTYFTQSSNSGGQDGVSGCNSSGTTANCHIAAVATGYWSDSSSQWTNVFTNGTKVSTDKLINTRRPTSVTSSNVGAIASAAVTCTENGDGYACLYGYKAK